MVRVHAHFLAAYIEEGAGVLLVVFDCIGHTVRLVRNAAVLEEAVCAAPFLSPKPTLVVALLIDAVPKGANG